MAAAASGTNKAYSLNYIHLQEEASPPNLLIHGNPNPDEFQSHCFARLAFNAITLAWIACMDSLLAVA
jgi:hypothetical protein